MAKRAKKILLLVHPRFRPDRARTGADTERDVWNGLRALGYTVEVAAVAQDLATLERALTAFRPDVAFNLLEEFRGEAVYDFLPVAYLEARGVAYTGANPRGLVQSRDKALVGTIARGLNIPSPRGDVGLKRSAPTGWRYPLFVKLNREHASLGLRESSRVRHARALACEMRRLRTNFPQSEILVQEFVSGRDVSVAVWGHRAVESLPMRQLVMRGQVATERLKFSRGLQRRRRAQSRPFDDPRVPTMARDSRRLYRALDLSGYARFDYRIPMDGSAARLIDVNPNPNLARDEDFTLSARAAGWDYPDVLRQIIRLALNYRPRV